MAATGAATSRRRVSVGVERAEKLYAQVFNEYGDDSVAQLGGAHIACEYVSNVLTKVLEWGRLMAYLEQSTRYVPYTDTLHGRWRYHIPSELRAALRERYVADDGRGIRGVCAAGSRPCRSTSRDGYPKGTGRFRCRASRRDSSQGARHAPRHAAGGDAVERRHLRDGQAFEALLLRMCAHPLDRSADVRATRCWPSCAR